MMSRRTLRHTKEIDYLLMNDQGLEGSLKTAMAAKEDHMVSKHVEDESQSKMGSDREADDVGVRSSTHQGTSDDSDGDDDILRAEQEINAKMEAAEREKKRSEKDAIAGTIGARKSEALR